MGGTIGIAADRGNAHLTQATHGNGSGNLTT
jgi:hypothetical protein